MLTFITIRIIEAVNTWHRSMPESDICVAEVFIYLYVIFMCIPGQPPFKMWLNVMNHCSMYNSTSCNDANVIPIYSHRASEAQSFDAHPHLEQIYILQGSRSHSKASRFFALGHWSMLAMTGQEGDLRRFQRDNKWEGLSMLDTKPIGSKRHGNTSFKLRFQTSYS